MDLRFNRCKKTNILTLLSKSVHCIRSPLFIVSVSNVQVEFLTLHIFIFQHFTFKIIRVADHLVVTTGPVNHLVMVCSVIVPKNSVVTSVRFWYPVSNLRKISLEIVYGSTKN